MKSHPIHAEATVEWRDSNEIGKVMPPPNSTHFAATARFPEDDKLALFSVVLYYSPLQSPKEKLNHKVKLHFLAPDFVLPKVSMGSKLYITDGVKIIAEARIDKIE